MKEMSSGNRRMVSPFREHLFLPPSGRASPLFYRGDPLFLMDLREEGSQKGSFFVKVSLSDPDPPPALEEAGSDGDSFGLGEGVGRKSFFGGDHCDRNPTAERLYVE